MFILKPWVFTSFSGDISPTVTTQKLPCFEVTTLTQSSVTHQILLSLPALINQSDFIESLQLGSDSHVCLQV